MHPQAARVNAPPVGEIRLNASSGSCCSSAFCCGRREEACAVDQCIGTGIRKNFFWGVSKHFRERPLPIFRDMLRVVF